jgi:hypothetical protein
LQQLSQRQGPEPLAKTIWGAGDQRMQGRDGPGPERNRLPAGGQQHPDGFPVATPGGGQAFDQANTTAGSGASSKDGQVPFRAPSAGPISFWVTSPPPIPVSDDAPRNGWIQTHNQSSVAVDSRNNATTRGLALVSVVLVRGDP